MHTPIPWKIGSAYHHIVDESDCLVADMLPPNAVANTPFIVRACNSHDALVQALEELVEKSAGWYPAGSARIDARAILAKLKEDT